MLTLDERRALMQVARGERPADLVIRGATLANVYSGELHPAHVAIYRGRIAYVGSRLTGVGPHTQVLDAEGLILAPGLVEPHAHPFVLYTPTGLVEGTLPRGTTAHFADDMILVYHGAPGIGAAADVAKELPVYLRWLARAAPATAGRPLFPPDEVRGRLGHAQTAGMMEYGRWPLQYRGDPPLLGAAQAALRLGKRVEGHLSGASAERLSALVASGITSDHEPIRAQEVVDRLRVGLWVMLRHSSLRPDLPEVIRAVTEAGVDTARLMFTTDGSTPAFIAEHGHLDEMLRIAVKAGVPPVRALQMATRNPATYYGAEGDIGGVAPGRRADLLLLPDLETFRPVRVLAAGQVVAEEGRLTAALPPGEAWARCCAVNPLPPAERVARPDLHAVPAPDAGPVPVIDHTNAVITRRIDVDVPRQDGRVDLSGRPGLLHAALFDQRGGRLARALVAGLGEVEGFATTYTVARGVLSLGRDPRAMALAARRVVELGGGFVVVEAGEVAWEFPLTVSAYMSPQPFAVLVEAERALRERLVRRGYPHNDVLYSLSFLTGDFLPRVRLTPAGLLDVMEEKVLVPSVPLG
ncbi:adenine deaminase C-terminal domain-containing protein [Caldinitratiruptor microaerophilus]|uniref:adenine deaminase n=1 Tax=Caldinitratiruptor microaerophilus TaxID=671077 RepID=A0AA35CNQ9_9FIRM|nr:adenine deaminase C-terminal domain-containing protein [Caldinitratiruptor microaerophilus]BDG60685.1 putative adenine deaminase YerA [Caldinitratiruptor microaerophilus]